MLCGLMDLVFLARDFLACGRELYIYLCVYFRPRHRENLFSRVSISAIALS
jgi:hypothetical protein